jgi:hypothetical protein
MGFDALQLIGKMQATYSATGWMTAPLLYKRPMSSDRDYCRMNVIAWMFCLQTIAERIATILLLYKRPLERDNISSTMTHALKLIDVACARAFKASLRNNIDLFGNHSNDLMFATNSEVSRICVMLTMASLSSLANFLMGIYLNGCAMRIAPKLTSAGPDVTKCPRKPRESGTDRPHEEAGKISSRVVGNDERRFLDCATRVNQQELKCVERESEE